MAEPGFRQPYVQIRGDFRCSLSRGPNIREDGEDGRLVEGKLGVIIPHSCFPDPLPVFGVRKGRFSQDVQPVMEFRLLNKSSHILEAGALTARFGQGSVD